MPRRIAVWSHKGGVGATTIVSIIATILSQEEGKRILIVDLDGTASIVELAAGFDFTTTKTFPDVELLPSETAVDVIDAGRYEPEDTDAIGIGASDETTQVQAPPADSDPFLHRVRKLNIGLASIEADYDLTIFDNGLGGWQGQTGLLLADRVIAVAHSFEEAQSAPFGYEWAIDDLTNRLNNYDETVELYPADFSPQNSIIVNETMPAQTRPTVSQSDIKYSPLAEIPNSHLISKLWEEQDTSALQNIWRGGTDNNIGPGDSREIRQALDLIITDLIDEHPTWE